MTMPAQTVSSDDDKAINLRLWLGFLLPPACGGLNTLVGYMVSNYDCNVHNRHFVFLVNVLAMIGCITAAAVLLVARRKIEHIPDDGSQSLLHSRIFMMRLGLCLAAGFFLFVCAGTLSTFLLHSCDL